MKPHIVTTQEQPFRRFIVFAKDSWFAFRQIEDGGRFINPWTKEEGDEIEGIVVHSAFPLDRAKATSFDLPVFT